MAALRRRLIYILLPATLGLMFGFEVILSSVNITEEVFSELKDFQTKQLDIFLEMNKLMTTLATVAIGAAAGFLAGKKAADVPSRRVLPVWILFGVSLYCGFLANQQVVWMLSKRFFNLYYPGIAWPSRIQFWAFLLGVFLMADVVYSSLGQEKGESS